MGNGLSVLRKFAGAPHELVEGGLVATMGTSLIDKKIQALYSAFVTKHPKEFFFAFPVLLHTSIFWGLGGLFLWLDKYKYPPLYKYKIQKEEVSDASIIKCVRRVLFNQFIFLLVPMISAYLLRSDRVVKTVLYRPIPSWKTLIAHVLFAYICEEAGFYWSHRALHLPKYYKDIHKIHHEFRAPIAIAAEYAHPIEFIFSNIIPGAVGPMLLNSHIIVTWLWVAIGLIFTLIHHSGYNFPIFVGPFSPLPHDYHHYAFNANYGVFGFFDWLCQTDKGFQEYKNGAKDDNKEIQKAIKLSDI